jgi:hypothetical protein
MAEKKTSEQVNVVDAPEGSRDPNWKKPAKPSPADVNYPMKPTDMEFYLNEKGKIWVKFTDPKDGRRFPANHPVVEAVLYNTISGNGTSVVGKARFESFKQRCYATALGEFRNREDNEDLQLEQDSLVTTILMFMMQRVTMEGIVEEHRLRFEGSQGFLYKELADARKKQGWPEADWPKPHRGHFAAYLADHKQQLAEVNLKLIFLPRTNVERPVRIEWIDPDNIRGWEFPKLKRNPKGDASDAKD